MKKKNLDFYKINDVIATQVACSNIVEYGIRVLSFTAGNYT